MRTRIRKWGSSLAIFIPETVGTELRLREDTPVVLSLVDGRLVVSPAGMEELALEQLLSRITEQNLHGEVDTGDAVAREVW